MSKFLAIVFAYMLSISSAFASEATSTNSAQNALAAIIANDQGLKANNLRVVIIKGKAELEAAKYQNLRVISLKIDVKMDKFYAVMASDISTFEVSGKFERLKQIPVMARKMNKGETITPSDVTYAGVNEKTIKRGFIIDEKFLIGKALSRGIQANMPVLPTSLTEASLIKRDATVTAIYKSDLLTIQDNVIALEDGALGDVIRLKNISSQRPIRGKVISANTVEITGMAKQLASN